MRVSIRTRILSAFGLSFALFLFAMGYSIVQLQALGYDLRLVNEGYLPLAKIAARLESYQDRIDLDLARLQRDGLRPMAAFRSNASLHTAGITAATGRGLTTARQALQHTANPAEQEALQSVIELLLRIDEQVVAYESLGQQWREQVEGTDPVAEQDAQADLLRRQKELQATVKQLVALLDGRVREANERIARIQGRAAVVGGGLAALALAFGIAMLAWTLLTLRPIQRLTTEVQRVAAGDYSGRIQVQRDDEIGVLASEFNTMAHNLAERDRRLVERADELNRLSRYLRSVLDAIHLGLVVEESARVTMVNPAAKEMWEVKEALPLPDFLAGLPPGRQLALPLGERRFDMEILPFGPGGRLVVGEDVTRKLSDQERLERSERLALIGQMLAQICHEIRNPLNAISLNAELLGEEIQALDPQQGTEGATLLGIISQEILRLEQITEHYLDLARRPAPSFHRADPARMTASVANLEKPAFERAGIHLELTVTGEGQTVPIDENQLRRALINVLENARHSGADRVEVSTVSLPDAMEIRVRDNGRGMDRQTLKQAFEPFFSTRPRGTGLGLAITHQILEEHGGHVVCETQPGQGCEVRLIIPRS